MVWYCPYTVALCIIATLRHARYSVSIPSRFDFSYDVSPQSELAQALTLVGKGFKIILNTIIGPTRAKARFQDVYISTSEWIGEKKPHLIRYFQIGQLNPFSFKVLAPIYE